MLKFKISKIWILAFLLAAVMAGCSDPDKNTGGPTSPLTPPTVISVFPAGASTGVCQGTLITATFSKAMNPATINTGTFTLVAGTTPAPGKVSLDSAGLVATFTPSSPLAVNTAHTATITTGAADTFGNPPAAAFQWMFTTNPTPCPGPFGLPGCGFGILGATPVVSNVGPTNVTGDVGIFPAASITGFSLTGGPGTITGAFHAADGVAQAAQDQLTLAYNAAAGAPGGAVLTADIGGQTLAPGVYKTTSAQPSLGITGDLHLNGNGIYIFQIVSTLTTAAGAPGLPASQVFLDGGAQSKNVFWQVGSSATLGTYSIFAGTIMAQADITLTTGAVLNGRAQARTGKVAMDSNPVNVPSCP
jgi:hypothetical protein